MRATLPDIVAALRTEAGECRQHAPRRPGPMAVWLDARADEIPGALHDAIVSLSPWMQHHRRCARVTQITDCDCGLQAVLAPYQWRI